MGMDFSGSAGAASDFDLLPKGLLVWANLTVRGVKTSATPSQYLDVELTVDQGQPFAGRKLWDKIGDPHFAANSEKYRQMGQIAITRILEAGRGAGPSNPAGYQIENYSQLSGLRVPIKVGIEGGDGGHEDKNRVAEWLTPNPASQSGYKGFERLQKGDHGLAAPATNGGNAGGFGGQGGGGFGQAQQTGGGFGGGSAAQPAQQPGNGSGGFGSPGFQQPPADSSGQSGANGAGTAGTNGAGAAATSPSSQPGRATTGNWLEQAGGAPTA